MKAFKIFAAIALLFIESSGDEYRSKINSGYDYYKSGQYDKAIDNYKQAGVLKPEKAIPNYNKGTAVYKSQDYKQASSDFGTAIQKESDPALLGDAYYNLGNSYYKLNDYDAAVKSYIEALKNNPKDEDSKKNLELSLLKQQQQRQQQQQNTDKQNENDKKNENQSKNENKRDEGKQQGKQEPQSSNEQDKPQGKNKPDNLNEPVDKMSKEQAENLLARYNDDEKEVQKQLRQLKNRKSSKNDW